MNLEYANIITNIQGILGEKEENGMSIRSNDSAIKSYEIAGNEIADIERLVSESILSSISDYSHRELNLFLSCIFNFKIDSELSEYSTIKRCYIALCDKGFAVIILNSDWIFD